jgi:hypothetical protein
LGFFGKVWHDENYESKKTNKEPYKRKANGGKFYRGFWKAKDIKETNIYNSWVFLYASVYIMNFVVKTLRLVSKGMDDMITKKLNLLPIYIMDSCGFIPHYDIYSKKNKRNKKVIFFI